MDKRQPWAFHLAWFKPRRIWPERFDEVVAAIIGTVGLGFAAIFFGIAVSVILE